MLSTVSMMHTLGLLSPPQKREAMQRLCDDEETLDSILEILCHHLTRHRNQALATAVTQTATAVLNEGRPTPTADGAVESAMTKIADPILSEIGSYLELRELTNMERVSRQFYCSSRRFPALSILHEGDLSKWSDQKERAPQEFARCDFDRFRAVRDLTANAKDLRFPAAIGRVFQSVAKLCFAEQSVARMAASSVFFDFGGIRHLELFCVDFEIEDAVQWMDLLRRFPKMESLTVDTSFCECDDPNAFGDEMAAKWTESEPILPNLTAVTVLNSHSVITDKVLNAVADRIEVLRLHQTEATKMAFPVHSILSGGLRWSKLREIRIWIDHGPSFFEAVRFLADHRMDRLKSLDLSVRSEVGWEATNDAAWDALERILNEHDLDHFRFKGLRGSMLSSI